MHVPDKPPTHALDEVRNAAIASCAMVKAPLSHVPFGSNVHDMLRSQISLRDDVDCSSFMVVDLAVIARQFFLFRRYLPNIQFHYAVKCFPDVVVLNMLAHLGASFDCASADEIQLVSGVLAKMNMDNKNRNKIILANPIKSYYDLKVANEHDVQTVTLDCIEELDKIYKYLSVLASSDYKVQILLRIATDDHSSGLPLSSKFGIKSTQEVLDILDHYVRNACYNANVEIKGIAFHVGSSANSTEPYNAAFKKIADIFHVAQEEYNITMNVIDVGGGFPGSDDVHPGSVGVPKLHFKDIANCIQSNISYYFGHVVDLKILAEPGRFAACQCATLATKIERVFTTHAADKFKYCVHNGIHEYFRDAWLFDYCYIPNVLLQYSDFDDDRGAKTVQQYESDVLGITMEVGDVIAKDAWLPKLNRGDWIAFDNMGSYASCLATARTDVPRAKILYAFSDDTLF